MRTALRFLRLRVGTWEPLAKALRYEWDSIQKVATGRPAVTLALALRAAQLAGIRDPDERAARRAVAVGPGLPALQPPAGRLRGRGDTRRVGEGNETHRE